MLRSCNGSNFANHANVVIIKKISNEQPTGAFEEIDMKHDRSIKTGAIAWGVLAFFSSVIPVFHAIPDLVLTIYKQDGSTVNLPEGFTFPYWIAGTVYEPIMVICLVLFGTGFLSIWKKTRQKIALVNVLVIFVYAVTRAFWGWLHINYAQSVEVLGATSNWEAFASAEMFQGLGAAINGVVAITLVVCLTLFFSRTNKDRSNTNLGKIGGIIVLASLIPAVVANVLSRWYLPYAMTGVFIVLMNSKSLGLGLMAIDLYRQSGGFQFSSPGQGAG